MLDYRPTDLVKIDILVNAEPGRRAGLNWCTATRPTRAKALHYCERLSRTIPRHQFKIADPGQRSAARHHRPHQTIKAVRKDVTAKCYGGDITRKRRTGDRARRKRYVDHLLTEIDLCSDSPLRFDTIYFGGGTPSSLEAEDLARIVDTLHARLRFADETRVYIEVNPEDVSPETTAAWKQLGVNTISLGIQSLNPSRLSFLGRQHGPDDARGSIETARDAGFQTVSIDLIYGMPGQTAADWRSELDQALGLEPDHISCYQLTIHQALGSGCWRSAGSCLSFHPTRRPIYSSSHTDISMERACRATRYRNSPCAPNIVRGTTSSTGITHPTSV